MNQIEYVGTGLLWAFGYLTAGCWFGWFARGIVDDHRHRAVRNRP